MSRRFDVNRQTLFLGLGLVAALFSPAALAQSAKATCMSLLTSEEIAKAIGEPFKDLGSQAGRSGGTTCEWELRPGTPGAKTILFSFYDNVTIKASPAYASPDAYFESVVSGAETKGKREMLPGIGVKTALVGTSPHLAFVVQRADGVGQLIGLNLTKAQMSALARAVAAP